MQNRHALTVLFLFLFCLRAAGAQIIHEKNVGDKTVMCMRSGLTSDLQDCGARADWYSYVFVGLISGVTAAKNDEKEIQIVPEEVFLGAPPTLLTVLTSQGLCLPKLAIGDRWLFYLRKQKDAPIVLDYYGNDSRPTADAQKQIETLRRLRNLGDFAIVRGQVVRGWGFDVKAVSHARVIAVRVHDSLRFISTTGLDGHYEFQPLPPGEYKITVDPIGSFQPDDSRVDASRGACWDLTLTRNSHAQIGGYVRRSNGEAVPKVDLVLINSDNSGYVTTQTDQNGYFVFDSQGPGKFVVGLNFPASPDWFNGGGTGIGVKIPPASLFYPGVSNRSSAQVIRLATDQKLDDIDFILPVK